MINTSKKINKSRSVFKKDTFLEELIIMLFFSVATIEVVAEVFQYMPLVYLFTPLIPALLIVLYWNTSNERNSLFIVLVIFGMVSSVLFIKSTEKDLFIALISAFVYRIWMIYYILKIEKIKDYFPALLIMIPLLFSFFYLLSILDEFPKRTYYILIFQIILVSFLGGITVSGYFMKNNKKNIWLLLYGLLAISLTFIIYIEKLFLFNMASINFRPMAMVLATGCYFTFYKFVVENEKLNNNRLS